jgi:hypothetical protein
MMTWTTLFYVASISAIVILLIQLPSVAYKK